MPVTDGYEACEKIHKLFNKNLNVNCGVSPNKKKSSKNNIKSSPSLEIIGEFSKEYTPVMIAVSSFVNHQINKRVNDVGFNQLIEIPLSYE